jgi:hypothetical protein
MPEAHLGEPPGLESRTPAPNIGSQETPRVSLVSYSDNRPVTEDQR